MKKVLVLLLLMVSTNIFAEWTRVGEGEDGYTTIYFDIQSIRKKGNKVKMWILYDFRVVQKSKSENVKYSSQINNSEYDCDEITRRILDFNWYSGNMGRGEVVFSSPNRKDEPRSIIPSSIDDGFFKIACSKG